MDELGRGTSNKEGSSIAWGVAEALLAANSFTLFVTHYPLLLSLSPLYPNVRNVRREYRYEPDDDTATATTFATTNRFHNYVTTITITIPTTTAIALRSTLPSIQLRQQTVHHLPSSSTLLPLVKIKIL